MSYNKYNTRHSSGRYNTPARFVPAGELTSGRPTFYGSNHVTTNYTPDLQTPPPPAPPTPLESSTLAQSFPTATDMQEEDTTIGSNRQGGEHPRSRFLGLKKLSMRERRYKQNQTLRRLLTPKNAVMVLNEMLPKDHMTSFKVDPTVIPGQPQKPKQMPSFCADYTLDGVTYKGYGDNKMAARNAAAEQAIRDIIIKRMNRSIVKQEASAVGSEADSDSVSEAGEIPMLQLASFALHKLFSEWESTGVRVPTLRTQATQQQNEVMEGIDTADSVKVGGTGPPAPRPLPADAGSLHPCSLLAQMRPGLQYTELGVTGDRPQNVQYTLGVTVDGTLYVGKASKKKEARRLAAKSACEALYNVTFDN